MKALTNASVILLVAAACGVCLPEPAAGAEPAPVNPYRGMQSREEVFEFAQKPAARKEGDRWIVTFASKAACDATVSILDKDGKIVRHLASGVLGKNAPHPFQQDSLGQELEWDGQTDDFRKAPAGCMVRVSLGIKAEFDRNLLWSPHDVRPLTPSKLRPIIMATGADGTRYVGGAFGNVGCVGRAFDKDGKYLYSFFPPRAADAGKLLVAQGYKFAATVWGDKVPVISPNYFGFTGYHRSNPALPKIHPSKLGPEHLFSDLVAAIRAQPGAGEVKILETDDTGLPAPKHVVPGQPPSQFLPAQAPRLAVHRRTDELYVLNARSESNYSLLRLDGKTGDLDKDWFPDGSFDTVGEVDVGPDDLIYVRTGPFAYGHWLFRVDRAGQPVPFAHNAESVEGAVAESVAAKAAWIKEKGKWSGECGRVGGPPRAFKGKELTAVYTGVAEAHSRVHEKGLDVAYNGNIVTVIQPIYNQAKCIEWQRKHGVSFPTDTYFRFYVTVWGNDGKLLSADAVWDTAPDTQGVHMDREGNLYTAQSFVLPPGNDRKIDGMVDLQVGSGAGQFALWASLVKFRGRGGSYPLGVMTTVAGGVHKPVPDRQRQPPSFSDHTELAAMRAKGTAQGALWAYGGLNERPTACTCNHTRRDMDGWARTWIPSMHLYSVVVIDSNGNRIARIGRYGNVDDADEKHGRIHMAWPRAVAVSDTGLYVMDYGNLRIFRCKLSYAAEESMALP